MCGTANEPYSPKRVVSISALSIDTTLSSDAPLY